MSSAVERFTPGRVIAGKYRIERVVGVGGMGLVVSATHLQLLQPVALKFLLAQADDPAANERFLREARAAVRLTSQHVCRVLDVDTTDDGEPFMVMEYLEGTDLWALLQERAPSLEEALSYIEQACDALSEAHALGIVHRDLKPSNLFLVQRPGGAPVLKVLDFGVSKINNASISGEKAIVTQQGTMLGSPAYMAPEQITATATVDARADIWSLGVVLYELVTRKLPFQASTLMELGARVLHGAPAPPSAHRPDLPKAIEAVILRCLEKEPGRRFQSAAELAAALRDPSTSAAFLATIPGGPAIITGSAPHALTTTNSDEAPARPRRALYWALAAIVFAASAVAVALAFPSRPKSVASPPPPAPSEIPSAVATASSPPSASAPAPVASTPPRHPRPTRPIAAPRPTPAPPPPPAPAPTATSLPDER